MLFISDISLTEYIYLILTTTIKKFLLAAINTDNWNVYRNANE